MDFSYFLENNKSGYKSREPWFRKNHPEEYDFIESYSSRFYSDMSFKEKVWFYYHKLTERPKCLTCKAEMKFTDRFDRPYLDFCSLSCANSNKEEMLNRQKATLLNKYGVDSFFKTDGFYEKMKEIKENRYGDPNYVNKDKAKETKLKKYGDPNYNNKEKNRETCLLRYGNELFVKTKQYEEIVKNNYFKLYEGANIKSVNKNTVEYYCDTCGEVSEIKKQLFYERNRDNKIFCTKCLPEGLSNKSSYEIELINYLSHFGLICESGKPIGSSRREIDVFIPEKKLGIEINGLYWHSDVFRDRHYHIRKTKDCSAIGVNLLHIFEDEWVNKKDIVLSIIKNRVGLSEKKLFARKCEIKALTNKEIKNFLNENHIQGYAFSSINLGLIYGGELVSVMTFGKGRISLNADRSEWEMVRFANKINHSVIGGASRLFKFFIQNYNPSKVHTFSDIRLFDGRLYETLGFTKKHETKPNYWYVVNKKRFHRFNFRKSKLVSEGFDPNKSEFEIMRERNINKIYDCGNIKWIYER